MTKEEFRKIRLSLELTQVELANVLGFSKDHVSRIETGKNPITRMVSTVMSMIKVHGIK